MRLVYWDCKERMFEVNACYPDIWFYNFNAIQVFRFLILKTSNKDSILK